MDFRILLKKITPSLKYIARKHLLYGFYDEEDLYQEMCLYLWQNYANGLPIGINEAYIIKGCEFHIQNFLRKGRPKAPLLSLEKLISTKELTLGDILEDNKTNPEADIDYKLTVDGIKSIGLNNKEQMVVSCLLKGYTVREVAKEMGCSHVMVIKHKKNIIKKWREKGYQK